MSDRNANRAEHLAPDPARQILWAVSPMEQQVDALRSRNWITEELIGFSQKHWHCSREEALERLLSQTPDA